MREVYEKIAVAPVAIAAGVGGRALISAGVRALGSGLWHGARALVGSPSTKALTGAANLGRKAGTGINAVNQVGQVVNTARDLMPSPPPAPTPPSVNSAGIQATGLSPKLGALEARLTKMAFGPSNAANIASYLSLIGAEVLPHEHPWHARLEAAGLGGLAASQVGSMITDPEERGPGQKDLLGLALFGSALRDRMRQKHAFIGPAMDVSFGGIPSAIGALHGQTVTYTPEEAQAQLKERFNIPNFLLLPGYTGLHFGQRAAAERALRRAGVSSPKRRPIYEPRNAPLSEDHMKSGAEKTAGPALSLGALGTGLGAGIGAVHGFYSDDPRESFDHHLRQALRSGGVGAGIGGGVGLGLGGAFRLAAPKAYARVAAGPFPQHANTTTPISELLATGTPEAHTELSQRALRGLAQAWTHPVTRLAGGAYLGYHGADAVRRFYDDVNLQQFAAQEAHHANPEQPNAAHLGAALARRHMGDYRSSLDHSA